MRRLTPLALLVAVVATAVLLPAVAVAQEQPPDLPPGFTDGTPVGGDDPAPATAGNGLTPEATVGAEGVQPAALTRYFGDGAYAAVRASVAATSRSCSITNDGLTALVLAPVFKESSAATTPSSAPSPMTLSRYDEWNGTYATTSNSSANYGLYAFRDPYTAYQRAYWHPGIGIWQYDSAGVGAPFTAVERMDVGIVSGEVAKLMATKYCNASGSDQQRRYAAWADWGYPCTLCQGFFEEMTGTSPKFKNLSLVPGVSKLGGTVERTCRLPGVSGTVRCWYVNPAVGVIQGATAWATVSPTGGSGPTVAPAPLSQPFYVVDRGSTEERHWIRADTGYGTDISAVRQIGKNARPRSTQSGSGLTWRSSSGLCDLTAGRGDCGSLEPPAPPAGMSSAALTVNGTYRAISADFNGDNRGDVLWYAPGSGPDSIWLGQGGGAFTSVSVSVNGNYDDVQSADVTGDGFDDVLWYDRASGAAYLWRSLGNGQFSTVGLGPGAARIPLLVDIDGDSDDEIFWYGPGSLSDSTWQWTGSGFAGSATPINGTYKPFVGDFDHNGRDDIFWYAPGTAPDYVRLHKVAGGHLTLERRVNGTYRPSVGDFDGDGSDDIFWYAPGTASDHVWFGAGLAAFSSRGYTVNGAYEPVLVDLEGDGRDDVLWHAPGTGGDYWWRWSAGRSVTSVGLSIPGAHEALVGAFSAGGDDGILWYQPGATLDGLWYR